MSTYKNKLQEYCQKNKMPMPTYTTVYQINSWRSSVHIGNNLYSTDDAKLFSTKKAAEQEAARHALACHLDTNDLFDSVISSKIESSSSLDVLSLAPTKTLVIIDLHSVQLDASIDHADVYCFTTMKSVDTSGYPLYNIINTDDPSITLNDLMTYHVSKLLRGAPYDTKIILTSRTKPPIYAMLAADGYNVSHATSMIELYQNLDSCINI